MASAMPSEEKISEANRRQVQEALHRLGYYDGPIDGIFGPSTRAAIRSFQDSIGEKGTGHLTAAEASRLISPSWYLLAHVRPHDCSRKDRRLSESASPAVRTGEHGGCEAAVPIGSITPNDPPWPGLSGGFAASLAGPR
jgi:peptidoglycan hydrolase-like protein with peptidoglycan-binding domain